MDCQYFDPEKQKFRQISGNKIVDTNKVINVVLSNLAVRRDRRKQKIALKLMQACENYIKVRTVLYLSLVSCDGVLYCTLVYCTVLY